MLLLKCVLANTPIAEMKCSMRKAELYAARALKPSPPTISTSSKVC
jgi:hypothetical protein